MNPQSQVSYHFMIARNGEITQVVPIARMAWAQGTTVNPDNDRRHWSRSTVQLVQSLRGNVNWYSVGIGCEGVDEVMTTAQFNALVWLTRHIQAEVQRQFGHEIPLDRRHLVGHHEINPVTKPNCPGSRFPWEALISAVNSQTQPIVAAVTPQRHSDSATLDDIAREVINGRWGNGAERVRRLSEAGYDAAAVQARVNALLKKPETPRPQPIVAAVTPQRHSDSALTGGLLRRLKKRLRAAK
jgi:N-acetyl-anhydromuramyl-L-alanine amidase AmpD